MKLKSQKLKWLILLFFVLFSISIWIFGYYYPVVELDENLDLTQETAIRLLSSYTYYGDLGHFTVLISTLSILSLIILAILYVKNDIIIFKKFIKHIMLIINLIYFINNTFNYLFHILLKKFTIIVSNN